MVQEPLPATRWTSVLLLAKLWVAARNHRQFP